MNEQARAIWKTEKGGSLLGKMLSGTPMNDLDRETLKQLKRADPGKTDRAAADPAPPEKTQE